MRTCPVSLALVVYFSTSQSHSSEHPIYGYVEIDHSSAVHIKTPDGILQTLMYLERIELEVAVTLCDTIYVPELEFYDVNGTLSNGPYHPDSCIIFGPVEFSDPANLLQTGRYPFTVHLPSLLFTHLGPGATRYLEINARAWFACFPEPHKLVRSGVLPKLIASNAHTSQAVCIEPRTKPRLIQLVKNFQEPFSRIPLLSQNPHSFGVSLDALC
jgi:hypothetical protein